MTEKLEKQIIELIATDRLSIPMSSLSSKLTRTKQKLAEHMDLSEHDNDYVGERVYARVEEEYSTQKARTIREAVDDFSERYPSYGKILNGMIEAKRESKDTSLYFGVMPSKKLNSQDYVEVMKSLGFTGNAASALYPSLMNASRRISKKRDEDRSILLK